MSDQPIRFYQAGTFTVGNRLLPQVQAAAQGRVVVLTSSGYKWAPESGIEFDNLSSSRRAKSVPTIISAKL